MGYTAITEVDRIDLSDNTPADGDIAAFPTKMAASYTAIQTQLNQVADAITDLNALGLELDGKESQAQADAADALQQITNLYTVAGSNYSDIATAAGAINATLAGSAQVNHATAPSLSINRQDDSIATSNTIGSINFFGGTTLDTNEGARIAAYAAAAWTSGVSHPTRVSIWVTDVGDTSPTEVMRIDPDGDIGVGTSAPTAKLHVDGDGATSIFRVSGDFDQNGAYLSGTGNADGGTLYGLRNNIVYDSVAATSSTLIHFYDIPTIDGGGTLPTVNSMRAGMNFSSGSSAAVTAYTGILIQDVSDSSGGSTTLQDWTGIKIEDESLATGDTIGLHLNMASGTDKWNIYADGTAVNFFNGPVGIGGITEDMGTGEAKFIVAHNSTQQSSFVCTTGSVGHGTKIGFFANGRFDADEEFAALVPKFVSDPGAGGNQVGELAFELSGTETFRLLQDGGLNLVPQASAPASPAEGDIYYDSGSSMLKCYNGTTWKDCFT